MDDAPEPTPPDSGEPQQTSPDVAWMLPYASEHPDAGLTDDNRSEVRRIRAKVLEYRAQARRRIFRMYAVCVPLIAGILLAKFAVDIRPAHKPGWSAIALAVATPLFAISAGLAVRFYRQRHTSRPDSAALPPPDFTGLGGGPTLAEKLGQVVDDRSRE